jgi:hypothetical protein
MKKILAFLFIVFSYTQAAYGQELRCEYSRVGEWRVFSEVAGY